MATYVGLPPIQVTAALDQSGFNGGKYTSHFTSNILKGLNVPVFELYHAAITAVPGAATASIGFNPRMTWGFTAPAFGGGSEYHLSGTGWLLNPMQEFYFFWSTGTGTLPIVTAWFKMDLDVPANKRNLGLA